MSKIESNIAKEMAIGYIHGTVINTLTGKRIKIKGAYYKKLLSKGIPLLDLRPNKLPYSLDQLPIDIIRETMLRMDQKSLQHLTDISLMAKNIYKDKTFQREYLKYRPFNILPIEDRRIEIVPNLDKSKKIMFDMKNIFMDWHLVKSKNTKIQIDPDLLREVYIPIYKEYPKRFVDALNDDYRKNPEDKNKSLEVLLQELLPEEGIEQKIGGNYPFFIEGENWPKNSRGQYLTFNSQFVDPRPEHQNELVRIFIDEINQIRVGDQQKLDRFNINQSLDQKEERITPNTEKCTNKNLSPIDCKHIIGWILTYEYPISEISKAYTIMTGNSFYNIDYFEENPNYIAPLLPYIDFKIGGYGFRRRSREYPLTVINNVDPYHYLNDGAPLNLDENGIVIS